jgi:predicted AAA+ superfamily ATPase
MRDAFGWGLGQYIYHGGYPGSAGLIKAHDRWCRYIIDSLVETTISRDILLMTRVDKPALLRRLFDLGCLYSGQILSYQKMLGQLDDAGNTTTLAHYLSLLDGAGILTGLQKYAGQTVRRRASSPKFQVLNAALMTSACGLTMKEAKKEREYWGRLVESAVGAYLVNELKGKNVDVFYWSGGNREVDFVLNRGDAVVPIEVKSGRKARSLPGMDAFCAQFDVKRRLLVGERGIDLDEFLLTHPEEWLR